MKEILLSLFVILFSTSYSQKSHKLFVENNYHSAFDSAYQQYPDIPKGVLEAVSFSMTRFQHLTEPQESCSGVPAVYGLMGLTQDGKGYFRNNLSLVSRLSTISVADILESPQQNVLAYASAYHQLQNQKQLFSIESQSEIFASLSELPYEGLQKDFALNSFLYQVYWFLNNPTAQNIYSLPNYNINLERVFGAENLKVLSSHYVIIDHEEITNELGESYTSSTFNKSIQSTDYPSAIEDLTTCNFSSRSGTEISAITIHDTEGSYAGSISWFKNCDANVSAHYVLRSSDGQVTQMVLEVDKAWHVGSENPYTIGFEHEGYAAQLGWYTEAMYQSSADLARDVIQSGYEIPSLRVAYFPWAATTNYNATSTPGNCIRIKGHQHFPNQTHTDPGANWDWDYYYKLINQATDITVFTEQTGTITDDGGVSGDYTNDQRTIVSIRPVNAESITLNIQQFDIEENWDYLYIYEGETVFDTKIGEYSSTTIPSTIQVDNSAVTIEFRTDCATVEAGYVIDWTSQITGIDILKESGIDDYAIYPNPLGDILNIENENKEQYTVRLFDIKGRKVFSEQVPSGEKTHQIDLSSYHLSGGVYVLKIITKQTSKSIQIIKK